MFNFILFVSPPLFWVPLKCIMQFSSAPSDVSKCNQTKWRSWYTAPNGILKNHRRCSCACYAQLPMWFITAQKSAVGDIMQSCCLGIVHVIPGSREWAFKTNCPEEVLSGTKPSSKHKFPMTAWWHCWQSLLSPCWQMTTWYVSYL